MKNIQYNTREEVLNTIYNMVEESMCPGPDIKLEERTSFINDLEIESIDGLDIILRAENCFNVALPMKFLDNYQTIGDFADYILSKIKESGDKR